MTSHTIHANNYACVVLLLAVCCYVVNQFTDICICLFVYLPTDLSLTDNFHKFQLKIRLQTSRKQKTKAVNYDKKKNLIKTRRK
jgi:hypothetical protein